MASISERVAAAAGVNIQDGQIILTEGQIQAAQNTVRKILDMPTSDGKSLSSMWQNWRIIGEPVLDKYGLKIGLGLGAILSVGVLIGYTAGRK